MIPNFMGGAPRPVGTAMQAQNLNNMGPASSTSMPSRFQGPAGGQPPVRFMGGPRQFTGGGLVGPAGAVPRPAPATPVQAGPTPRGPLLGSYKKGGKVPKTGAYKLHAGERVLTKKQAKLVPVAMLLRAKKG